MTIRQSCARETRRRSSTSRRESSRDSASQQQRESLVTIERTLGRGRFGALRKVTGSPRHPEPLDFAARKQATLRVDALSTLAQRDPEAVARHYGVDTERGPYRLPDRLIPAKEASALAFTLANLSLEPLGRAFAARDRRLDAIPWQLRTAILIDRSTCKLGLPLLFACSDSAQEVARKRSLSRLGKRLKHQHAYHARQAAKLILWEQLLWHIAADHGGPCSSIPYATTFHALEWFWEPSLHATSDFQVPCLRCGALIEPKRPPRDFPQCEHCTKNSNLRKPWPAHAIAPAERGSWLLRCQAQNCTNWYLGTPQRLRCDTCPKTSDTSPHKRKPLRPRKASEWFAYSSLCSCILATYITSMDDPGVEDGSPTV